MSKKIFTEEERKILKEMFPNNCTAAICEKLNRSYSSVSNQAYMLGLKKSKALLAKNGERLKITGAAYRFPKGHISHNKGKKMSAEQYLKIAPTMFKNGHVPHNAIAVGGETIHRDKNGASYWMIKAPWQRKLISKHVYLWETKHGKVPKGYNIVFKDGDTLNCIIENLECISNEELMYRNNKQNYPREVIPTLVLINKIKKKINEK